MIIQDNANKGMGAEGQGWTHGKGEGWAAISEQ